MLFSINQLIKQFGNCHRKLSITRACRSTTMANNQHLKYLTQAEAINLDRELFDEYAFSVDQLMELAGLSVATAIARTYPKEKYSVPILCCGPGNNGGDGLVCARHLKLFGYSPLVICPKPGRGQLFENLLTQCKKFKIPVCEGVSFNGQNLFDDVGDLIVDSIFGFSFKPPNRNPDFALLLKLMHKYSKTMPIVSIDIPSGWHVENGDSNIESDQAEIDANLKIPALQPECLISLTAPKLCARSFKGKYHFLGGRFCPDSIEEKYQLNLSKFPEQDCIVRLS